jgi:hypothetical protein
MEKNLAVLDDESETIEIGGVYYSYEIYKEWKRKLLRLAASRKRTMEKVVANYFPSITEDRMKQVTEYIDLIDKEYVEAKKKGISRLSIEWGTWSAKMNREIREKRKNDRLYALVFAYRQNRSQLLELRYTRFKIPSKIRLSREGKRIRKELLKSLVARAGS